eukprot:549113-Rhodomonas_salina.1
MAHDGSVLLVHQRVRDCRAVLFRESDTWLERGFDGVCISKAMVSKHLSDVGGLAKVEGASSAIAHHFTAQ